VRTCHRHSAHHQLGKALAEGKLEERLKTSQQQLLIIDESDYLLIGRQGANWLFELVSRRYERGSSIITSNKALVPGTRSSATKRSRAPSLTVGSIIRSPSTSRAKASGSTKNSRPDFSNPNSPANRQ
jgi:IstB-like ATP binding protein